MEQAYRRTIDELITRYHLEPELRDLYVEGPSDKMLFLCFFEYLKCEHVEIFEIDTVNIQDSLINKLRLQSRNRDRVIALSLELDRLLQGNVECLACVADSDFDFLLGRTHDSRYLLYTDYTSVDLYFWSEDVVDRFFKLGVRRLASDPKRLLANFAAVLQEVFSIRAANEKLGWGLQWIQFTRSCSIEDNLVVFDADKFIEKYLSKNRRRQQLKEFIDACNQLRAVNVATCKQRIRGGDFFELLGWYALKQIGSRARKYRDPDVVRAIILPTVNLNLLADEELFVKLLAKYSRSRFR